MFENESHSNINIKKLNKYLCKTECLFLNRLHFWSSHRKSYGIKKDGKVWIYNTLDDWSNQLNVSKSSIRRAVQSLKDKKLIICMYLSPNKRDRTLYYAVNVDGINEYISKLNIVSSVHTHNLQLQKNTICEHMDEHMYIIDNSKQNINKSYKSKNFIKENSKNTSSDNPKPTIVQDMIRIFNEEFPKTKMILTKHLARNLVSAFKTKFNSCLKEWKRYLKLVKTSSYIISEKFKLSILWLIKFFTIDRIRVGELGVNSGRVTPDNEELVERLNQHVEYLNETESCKELRYSIIRKLSLPTYLSWFTKVSFSENDGKFTMKAESQFVEDWIKCNFADQCGLYFG